MKLIAMPEAKLCASNRGASLNGHSMGSSTDTCSNESPVSMTTRTRF